VLQYDFQESIGYWILMASHAYQQALAAEVAPHGITFRQCQVIGFLACEGPATQSHLAHRMGIEPPTLVGVLDRMERDGLIRRESCPGDRRKKLVHLTAAAEPVWEQIVGCAKRVRARASAGLSARQMQQLRAMLETVRLNLGDPHLITDEVA